MPQKEAKTQAQRRRSITALDQFGRAWSGTIEEDSMDFTGHLGPTDWDDPLRTPQQYVRMPKNAFGQLDYGRVEIDFRRWRRDCANADKAWLQTFYTVGKTLYAARFVPSEMMNDAYLLQQTGPRPVPSVQALDAAINPEHRAHLALLGFGPMNDSALKLLGKDPDAIRAAHEATLLAEDRARELDEEDRLTVVQFLALEPTYQEFTKWGRRRGLTIAELGARWTAYKLVAGIDQAAPEDAQEEASSEASSEEPSSTLTHELGDLETSGVADPVVAPVVAPARTPVEPAPRTAEV